MYWTNFAHGNEDIEEVQNELKKYMHNNKIKFIRGVWKNNN